MKNQQNNKIGEWLRERIPSKIYNLWFNTIRLESIKDKEITLTVANLFIKDWLIKKYDALFKKMVEDVFGAGYTYKLEIQGISTESSTTKKSRKKLIKKRPLLLCEFNKEFTFDTFVVGKSNELAYKASIEASKFPGEKYNPLFVFGGVGLGKTHLMHAIGQKALQLNPDLKVLYTTSERFMNDMISAIRSDNIMVFRDKYRKVDVLLVDDVQFLIGKSGIQKEFFHTFNDLFNLRKQIVITSDRLPQELDDFQERLTSRFEMGLMVGIKPPEPEIRYTIMKSLVAKEKVDIPDEILQEIMVKADQNVRRLKGIITRLIAFNSLTGQEITVGNCLSIISSILPDDNKGDPKTHLRVKTEYIKRIVAEEFGIKLKDMLDRKRRVALARQVAMYIMGNSGIPIKEIARSFSRVRSTVIYSLSKVEKTLNNSNNPALASKIKEIEKHLEKKESKVEA